MKLVITIVLGILITMVCVVNGAPTFETTLARSHTSLTDIMEADIQSLEAKIQALETMIQTDQNILENVVQGKSDVAHQVLLVNNMPVPKLGCFLCG